MPTIAETLAQAKTHHNAGRLRDAEVCYQQVVQADAANFEAHLLLGIVSQALARPNDAITNFARAILLRSDHVEAHILLGAALELTGRLDEAIAYFQQALRLSPHSVEASQRLRNAVASKNNDQGVACGIRGQLDKAVDCFRMAVQMQPDYVEAHNNLGVTLERQGKLDEAVASFRRALDLKPDYAEAHNNLGGCFKLQGKLEAAVASFRRALDLKPDYAEVHANLGGALQKQGNLDAAGDCCRRALQLKPDYADAHCNLGVVLEKQGRPNAAADCYRRALELEPDHAEAHHNFGHTLLRMGNFPEGWIEYEWRLKLKHMAETTLPRPRWTGFPLAGRTILLRSEQGLGDSLQFVRYAELVKQQGGTVMVACPRPLARIVATCPGVDRVVIPGESPPPFDVHLPLLSLPGIFRTSLDNIPAKVPYLRPDAQLVEHWQNTLGKHESQLKIGIAWQGNLQNADDRVRSIPLSRFVDIAQMPGARVYSLQMGAGREQLAEVARSCEITDLGDQLGDFHNTAAIMRNLDLVITCDSAPAHLAGALGVRVWVALAQVPDWRWMIDRTDSPWYPTMRLFRQTRPGYWQGVFRAMHTELAMMLQTATPTKP